MPSNYAQLVTRLSDLHNLNMAYWILMWDQQVVMPPGGAEARAAQMATLASIRHQMLTGDETARREVFHGRRAADPIQVPGANIPAFRTHNSTNPPHSRRE